MGEVLATCWVRRINQSGRAAVRIEKQLGDIDWGWGSWPRWEGLYLQIWAHLVGRDADPCCFSDESMDEMQEYAS